MRSIIRPVPASGPRDSTKPRGGADLPRRELPHRLREAAEKLLDGFQQRLLRRGGIARDVVGSLAGEGGQTRGQILCGLVNTPTEAAIRPGWRAARPRPPRIAPGPHQVPARPAAPPSPCPRNASPRGARASRTPPATDSSDARDCSRRFAASSRAALPSSALGLETLCYARDRVAMERTESPRSAPASRTAMASSRAAGAGAGRVAISSAVRSGNGGQFLANSIEARGKGRDGLQTPRWSWTESRPEVRSSESEPEAAWRDASSAPSDASTASSLSERALDAWRTSWRRVATRSSPRFEAISLRRERWTAPTRRRGGGGAGDGHPDPPRRAATPAATDDATSRAASRTVRSRRRRIPYRWTRDGFGKGGDDAVSASRVDSAWDRSASEGMRATRAHRPRRVRSDRAIRARSRAARKRLRWRRRRCRRTTLEEAPTASTSAIAERSRGEWSCRPRVSPPRPGRPTRRRG
jgi:hypothetical protein